MPRVCGMPMACGVPVELRNATGLQCRGTVAVPLWFSALLGPECLCSCFGGQPPGLAFPRRPGWGSHPAAPPRPGLALPRPLPANLSRPPGPARCPSSGGGGGGRGGGGNIGAGTALEGVGAGQLRRDWGSQPCPPAGTDCPHNLPPLPQLLDSSLMPGKLKLSRREVLGEKQWQSLEERGSAQLRQPKITRSRTYEPSCKDTEQAATGRQGPPSPSLSKQDSSYRRAFGELAEQDVLLGCFSCAWQREVPYHGRLYVSSRHICFHSNLLLKDIKAVVPVASISALKKTNTALLVPNAVSIRTARGEKFLFVSLRQREATYQLLRSVCKHLQESSQSLRDSVSNEETLRKSQVLSQSDLEQRTPEPNSLHKSLDKPSPRSRQAEHEDDGVALLVPSSGEWVPAAETCGLWGGHHTVLWAWATALWSQINPQLSSLNIIIIIYLLLMVALLLSSGYIGLRIAELEQQLAFAGAWPDLNLSQQYKTT
ncbi:GRAM domain-containing protein 2A-like isoform X2 [Prinia subflava]|uniref:GRAM domain-containing protein 2A-like isoform X2 n=1 Tax=Prinia subflava TaxID=208062 RepID=UPI002FE210D1